MKMSYMGPFKIPSIPKTIEETMAIYLNDAYRPSHRMGAMELLISLKWEMLDLEAYKSLAELREIELSLNCEIPMPEKYLM